MSEKYETRLQKATEKLDLLERTVSEDELKQRFFKNFGCINFQSDDFYDELALARLFHQRHEARHPECHDVRRYDEYTCYHVTKCKCGFREDCDSSD